MATLTPNGDKITLKYLFKAEFRDGTIITQNADDQSVIEDNRSCFFDVLEAQKELVRFSLEGEGQIWSVDLTSGHFTHNGIQFSLHEPIELENFRVLYCRVRDNHFNMGQEFLGHDIAYRIGWQANGKLDGKNYQNFIEIK